MCSLLCRFVFAIDVCGGVLVVLCVFVVVGVVVVRVR